MGAADVASDFSCGVSPLDSYFRKHALSNQERGIGRTYVLRAPDESADLPRVIGFYTLSMAQLEREELPEARLGALPAYPLPVALIGRLAVDKRIQGGGFGLALLTDALRRVQQVAELIGCLGIIVDAKNAKAEKFYERHGFRSTLGKRGGSFPRRMFLSIATLKAASES